MKKYYSIIEDDKLKDLFKLTDLKSKHYFLIDIESTHNLIEALAATSNIIYQALPEAFDAKNDFYFYCTANKYLLFPYHSDISSALIAQNWQKKKTLTLKNNDQNILRIKERFETDGYLCCYYEIRKSPNGSWEEISPLEFVSEADKEDSLEYTPTPPPISTMDILGNLSSSPHSHETHLASSPFEQARITPTQEILQVETLEQKRTSSLRFLDVLNFYLRPYMHAIAQAHASKHPFFRTPTLEDLSCEGSDEDNIQAPEAKRAKH